MNYDHDKVRDAQELAALNYGMHALHARTPNGQCLNLQPGQVDVFDLVTFRPGTYNSHRDLGWRNPNHTRWISEDGNLIGGIKGIVSLERPAHLPIVKVAAGDPFEGWS